MNYIKTNKVTNLPCSYKLYIYFMEFDSNQLDRNAKIIRYGEYQKTPKLELDYLLKELFNIVSKSKPFSLNRPTYNNDGSKHRGSNNVKKAIIYDTKSNKQIFDIDCWTIQLAKDILFNGIPLFPPDKLYLSLEPQEKQFFRNFYASFGWERQEIKAGNTYKKVWRNDFLIFKNKPVIKQSDKN